MSNGGSEIFQFAKLLAPYHRSLAGDENRKTLNHIKNYLPDLINLKYESGAKVFDWEVPKEWKVNKAYIRSPSGKIFCDVSSNPLHLVSYSRPFSGKVDLNTLKNHLHFLKNLPDAIPYITSYYKDYWGFCISYNEFLELEEGEFDVVVDTSLDDGFLNIGEYLIRGHSEEEILFSTYICHPFMANNELSGPVVQTFLAKWITENLDNYYSYRFLFLPETIGSICYINENLPELKARTKCAFILSCVGDTRQYSLVKSKRTDSYSTKVASYVLNQVDENYKQYDWRERGSDERQFGSPNVNLDVSVICRSKFGEYPEYHTSLDDLGTVVSPEGLQTSLELLKKLVLTFEYNHTLSSQVVCEPMLSKYDLYPTVSTKETINKIRDIRDIIDHADGETTILDVCVKYGIDIEDAFRISKTLESFGLIKLHRLKSYE